MENEVIVEARQLERIFPHGGEDIVALNNINLSIHKGEFVCLMGPSGSGKSTLLHIIAGIDRITGGSITVLGDDISKMSESQLSVWRNHHVGFVFQSFNLIPVLNARENVEMPLLLTSLNKRERAEHVETALRIVGLAERMTHYPRQLSGGEEQRVAVARALVADPDLILADEPTGDLDAHSAVEILTILQKLNQDQGKTVILVSHDPKSSSYATVTRHLDKGELLPEGAETN